MVLRALLVVRTIRRARSPAGVLVQVAVRRPVLELVAVLVVVRLLAHEAA